MDQEANKGRLTGSVGTEASCGPQLASDMETKEVGTGKCKNDSNVERRRLEK